MNQLFVDIDVGNQNNTVYLMKPDGEKHSSFRMQNNRGDAKLLTETIVSAIQSQGLEGVVIGMEATSIYENSLIKDMANTSATTLTLVEHFETADDLAYADLNELTAFITKTGRGRFADPEAIAKAVPSAARGIAHKLIPPRMPWHNGKVERSHRSDQRYFYDWEKFADVQELNRKLTSHLSWYNNRPMRSLGWSSPLQRLAPFSCPHH